MFKKLLILVLAIGFISCKKESKPDGFVINANIEQSANGKLAKLTGVDRSNPILLDSARIDDGRLTLTGKVDQPDIYLLTVEGLTNPLPVIIENESLDITLYMDSIQSSIVSGSKENDIFKSFIDMSKPIRKQGVLFGNQFREAQAKNDMAAMQNIRKKYDSLLKANTDNGIKKITKNNGSVVSAIMLEDYLRSKSITLKNAEEIYNNFTAEVKDSRAAKEIKRNIDASLATEIGSVAPKFSAPDPDGNIIALNDIMGKVTIVDFWASWCGPCRRENPNVVKVYNKYHGKGLEIIGVSLDGSDRQNNPKEAWLNAIANDSLNWHHVSNLNYFNDPVAKQYNINSIPATFILDSEGKILAKNLRGPALEQKISELLD